MEEPNNSENQLTSAAAFVDGGIQEAFDDSCSICLDDFCDSDPSTMTSCKHEFHLQCILEWCQRSSQCPMCLQHISLNDPSSQELLDAVEHERKLRTNRPRNTTSIFHHPTLRDFELPISASDSEFEERIIQHLATSAAMGRARQLARIEGRRSRTSAQGHPHFLLFSTHPNGPSATMVASSVNERDGSSTPPVVRIVASNSSLLSIGEDSMQLITGPSSTRGSIAAANQHGVSSTNWRSPTQTSPSGQERVGSSDFQSFSESLKSRVSAWSMKYKESLTRSTRGWKEKLFTRNISASCSSTEVLREVDHSIAPASRLMDHLEIREEDRTNIASKSGGTVDSSSANPTKQLIIETNAGLSVNDNSTQAPCAASSASS
ncbi:E3 ubiquitin-protein ligase RHF2A-like isoform X1 [Primulina eburnea]|uniref:E3 ubiquitin-protein ligase RHF2A-like isoform X1 n=2 Tax=Primulina eburnea TaxID=1245227 RepID=UPI003C6C961E